MTPRSDAFSVYVVDGLPLEHRHPDDHQQMRLLQAADRLVETHALAYCTGPQCEWFVRWPQRDIDTLHTYAHQHLGNDHIGDLLAGRAVIDPELSDGGYKYLLARIRMNRPMRRRSA